jgi:hypothetical protein
MLAGRNANWADEHYDHIDRLRLAGLGVPVHVPEGARLPGLDVVGHATGEDFDAAGFHVRTVGGRHAIVYGDSPDCPNLGYVVDDRLSHPGDSLDSPEPSRPSGRSASTTARSTSAAGKPSTIGSPPRPAVSARGCPLVASPREHARPEHARPEHARPEHAGPACRA